MKNEFREDKSVSQDMQKRTGTLLFADDDPDIRAVIKEILGISGYTVIEAIDGEDGIKKFMKYQDKIGLLVLDVVMPRKNGREAYEEIRKIKSDIKVIFISGCTRDMALDNWVYNGAVDFLSKPFLPGELLQKIREVLNK